MEFEAYPSLLQIRISFGQAYKNTTTFHRSTRKPTRGKGEGASHSFVLAANIHHPTPTTQTTPTQYTTHQHQQQQTTTVLFAIEVVCCSVVTLLACIFSLSLRERTSIWLLFVGQPYQTIDPSLSSTTIGRSTSTEQSTQLSHVRQNTTQDKKTHSIQGQHASLSLPLSLFHSFNLLERICR